MSVNTEREKAGAAAATVSAGLERRRALPADPKASAWRVCSAVCYWAISRLPYMSDVQNLLCCSALIVPEGLDTPNNMY